MTIMDKGIVKPLNTWTPRFTITRKARNPAMRLAEKKILIASFWPVCLTTPLWEPIRTKEINAIINTTGIW